MAFHGSPTLAMIMRYSGRTFSEDDLATIRELMITHPSSHRAALSRLVCDALNWRKANGGLKDMSCRVAMLRMQEDGLITLPSPRRQRYPGRLCFSVDTDPQAPIKQAANNLAPLQLRLVSPGQSRLWNEYIHRYHYLGYKTLPGAQLRYFVTSGNTLLALLGFGASAWQTAPRDRFIGWSHEQRQNNLHLIVNNARFLILPWIQSKNLASMILARACCSFSGMEERSAPSPTGANRAVMARRVGSSGIAGLSSPVA